MGPRAVDMAMKIRVRVRLVVGETEPPERLVVRADRVLHTAGSGAGTAAAGRRAGPHPGGRRRRRRRRPDEAAAAATELRAHGFPVTLYTDAPPADAPAGHPGCRDPGRADRHRPGHGGGRLAARPGRQHAARPPRPDRQAARLPPAGQVRVPQRRRQREGPAGGGHGRRRREGRAPPARRDDRRTDVGQHRRRAGHRRRPAPLPLRVRHARQDGAGEDQAAAGLRRRGRGVPDGGGAVRPRLVLLGGQPPDRGDPRRLPAQPVPQPGEPGVARAHAPGRRSGARRPGGSPTSWPASAPAARSAASGST